MEKLVLTTYRKILKMGSALDQDAGKRSVVSCAPTSFFNHRTSTWVEMDIAKEIGWPEPRAFLDKLIRRLNGNRENYIPPTAEELELAHASVAAALATTGTTAPSTTPSAAPAADSSTATGAVSVIPSAVAPFMPIHKAARVLFESTPFSMNNLNKAFAAVKELSYACECFQEPATSPSPSAAATAGSSSSSRGARRLVSLTQELDAMPTPALKRALMVAPAEDLQLMRGLSDELRESLRMMAPDKGDVLRQAERRGDDDDDADEDDEDDDVVVTVVTEMDGESQVPVEAHTIVSRRGGSEDTVRPATHALADAPVADASGSGQATRATVFSSVSSTSLANSGEPKTPATIQFLVAHPQLTGFFQNTVMLVVRNADNESIALVLNAPLRRNVGTQLVVARDAICGFPGAHPVYEKYLQHNSVMVGGPVQTGETPDEVALLHQIPGVPGAIPLAANLFLHGDLDAIMAKLDAGDASPADIVILVGFAGWGRDQLQGEVRSGVWIVAQGDSEDAATGNFVMDLARASGSSLLVPPAAKATVPEPAAGASNASNPASVNDEVTRGVRRHVNFMATVRDGTVMAWIWALKAMGNPYASLGRNQKRAAKGKAEEYLK